MNLIFLNYKLKNYKFIYIYIYIEFKIHNIYIYIYIYVIYFFNVEFCLLSLTRFMSIRVYIHLIKIHMSKNMIFWLFLKMIKPYRYQS